MAWDYLDDPAFRVRQGIAVHFLRDCRSILEIGGSKNPITLDLRLTPDEVVVVDPIIEALAADELNGQPCSVRHYALDLVDFDFAPWRSKQFGVVVCGMDLSQGEKTPFQWLQLVCQFLYVLSRSEVAVIEYAVNWQPSANLFDLVLSILQPRIAADIRIDLTRYSEEEMSPEIRSRWLRRLTVLKDMERVENAEALHERVARILFGSEVAKIVLSKSRDAFVEVLGAFELQRAGRLGEVAEVRYAGQALAVRTAPQAWSYAALLQFAEAPDIPLGQQGPATVELQVYVDAGELAFGMLQQDWRLITGERLVKAVPGELQTVEIFVPELRGHIGLLCRNGQRDGTASEGRIMAAKFHVVRSGPERRKRDGFFGFRSK